MNPVQALQFTSPENLSNKSERISLQNVSIVVGAVGLAGLVISILVIGVLGIGSRGVRREARGSRGRIWIKIKVRISCQ